MRVLLKRLKKQKIKEKYEIESSEKGEDGGSDQNVHTIEVKEKDEGEIKRSFIIEESEVEKALIENQQIILHEYEEPYETNKSLPSLVNSLLQDFKDVTFELGEPFQVLGKIHDYANKLIVPVYDLRTNRLKEGGNDENHGGSTNNDTIRSVNPINCVGIG